jgi:tryptophan-rich sensory protein
MPQRTSRQQVIALVAWLAVTFTAAALGAVASVRAAEFYAQLDRPSWAPPASWFGPVWTTLYALMGVSAWLVWRETAQSGARAPLILFLVQLAINALWSWLFFAWRWGSLAFVDALLLALLIAATLLSFWRVNRLAAALLLPYLAWVSFATALTWSVWQANPASLK